MVEEPAQYTTFREERKTSRPQKTKRKKGTTVIDILADVSRVPRKPMAGCPRTAVLDPSISTVLM